MKVEFKNRTVLFGTLLTAIMLIGTIVTTQKAYSKELVKSNLSNAKISKNLASVPFAFTANLGQWESKVSFRASVSGATMWFADDGTYYQFSKIIESKPISNVDKDYGNLDKTENRRAKEFETMLIKASFVGSNANPTIRGLNVTEYKCNYYIGNDNSKWASDVPNYTAILYEQIYDGIDLKYYGNGKEMEYDFIVFPGADYSQIKIKYEGADSIYINDNGELVVRTGWGEVIEQRPVVYQLDANNNRAAIKAEYKINGTCAFAFELGDYNRELILVIDPVLSYSTFLGGSNNEIGQSIAVDNSGAAYVTGIVISTNFPTFNPYQGTFQGSSDAFVTKLSSTGNSLIYSTYFGGTFFEYGYDITVNDSGEAYITGDTDSDDFPILNPYQGTFQGINDAFVTKLSSTGSLVYSTYLGGDNYDYATGIAIDSFGAAYITGSTFSTDFPMLNPIQGTLQGSSTDVFVTKLSSIGNTLIYSTYLGGSKNDYSLDIAVNSSGEAYLTGETYSDDFQMFNSYQGTFQGGVRDAFVTKLSSSGSSLLYSTYLGGSNVDLGNAIAVDASGAAYITGRTSSTDFPTLNSYQGTFQGGLYDVFVTKLSNSGNALVYSTYLGGSVWDEGYGIEVDASGVAYIAGQTSSADFPMLNPYQMTYLGFSDVFVTKLSSTGNSLAFSTYLGGADIDYCYGIAIDNTGATYVTGQTYSTDFPIINPYQGTFQGGVWDIFVAKLIDDSPPPNCCVVPGDFDGSGSVDIADLTATVNWMFKGGAPSDCANDADVDASCNADITDLTYRVNYMFKGEADLICGCVE